MPHPRITPALAGLLVLGTALGFWQSCDGSPARAGSSGVSVSPAPADPIDFGRVPAFELTNQLGEPVSAASLRGRPWVMAAIFSTCSGPCPRVTSNMRKLQQALAGTDALLVSVSVDPQFDTPEVLREYAEAYGAEPGRWWFLTGEEEEVHALVRDGFLLAVERATGAELGQQVTHDTRLATVDRAGRLRGWYSGTGEEGLGALRARMEFLASEEL